jgi:NAD(P)-dependent dehydrogenase (short-subunit alcohol dehydrogenase family)
VTSSSHTLWTRDPLDDLAEGATSSGLARYGQTKLAATLWVSGFARRAEVSKVALYATNPGMAWTGMTTAISTATVPWWLAPLWPFFRLVQRRASPAAAARSSVLLAPAPGLERLTGGYFEKDGRPANNGVLRRWLPSAERMVQFVDALAAAPTPRNVSRAHPPG